MKPRIVVDTSVFVDANAPANHASARSVQSRAALELAQSQFQFIHSKNTERESVRMVRSYAAYTGQTGRVTSAMKKFFDTGSRMVHEKAAPVRCHDKDDQMFLDTAAGGQAKLLLTNDKDLWGLRHSGSTLILRPNQFNTLFQPNPQSNINIHVTQNRTLLDEGMVGDTVILNKNQARLLRKMGEDVPRVQANMAHAAIEVSGPARHPAERGNGRGPNLVISDMLKAVRVKDTMVMTPDLYSWLVTHPEDSRTQQVFPRIAKCEKVRPLPLAKPEPVAAQPKPGRAPQLRLP